MQTELRFELELIAVCTALKNAVLFGPWISIKGQQKLLVQKPEHKPDNTAFSWSHSGIFRGPEASSDGMVVVGLPTVMSHKHARYKSVTL